MAKKVKEFTHWYAQRPDRYPWDKWLNGDIWRISDDDLQAMPMVELMRYAHKKARERNIGLRAKRWDWDSKTGQYESLYLQAHPLEEGKENAEKANTSKRRSYFKGRRNKRG